MQASDDNSEPVTTAEQLVDAATTGTPVTPQSTGIDTKGMQCMAGGSPCIHERHVGHALSVVVTPNLAARAPNRTWARWCSDGEVEETDARLRRRGDGRSAGRGEEMGDGGARLGGGTRTMHLRGAVAVTSVRPSGPGLIKTGPEYLRA